MHFWLRARERSQSGVKWVDWSSAVGTEGLFVVVKERGEELRLVFRCGTRGQ